VVKDARGAYLWDAAGRKYIDCLLGSGPMLLGHSHPAVVEAVQRQLPHGSTFMLLNEPIIELAEEIVRAVPGAEQVRFMSSGSEATFFALRVARAFRQRDKIMKFEGGFHGTHDYALMSVSPRSPKAFPAAYGRLRRHSARHQRRGPDRAVQRPGDDRGAHRASITTTWPR
jgi:glutamate-1-semialdehyde 2,1-aminomutase